MITVSDVIALALPAGTRIAAGAEGLGREVTWATRLRPTPPAFGHLSGGELVLLPLQVLEELDEQLTLEDAVRQLATFGVAAIAVHGQAAQASLDAAEAAGIPLLILPEGADLGPLERNAARLITERRREVQLRGREVGRQLMELAISGEPLAVVVRAMADVSGRAVALEAWDGRLLAFHTPGGRGPARDQVAPLIEREHGALGRWLRATAASSPADPPTAAYDLNGAWARVVAPIIGRNGLLGSVSLIVPRGGATPEDGLTTANGAAACAVVLAREQAAASVRREVELHVLDEVLDGALRSETTLMQQAKRLGHDFEEPHVAIVARLDHPAGSGPVRAQNRDERWTVLDDVLARAGAPRTGGVLWRIRQNNAEIIWPVAVAADALRIATAVHDDLTALISSAGATSAAVSVGVGTPRPGIEGIRRSHQEARQALTLGRRLNGTGHLTPFERLGIFRLIFAAEHLPELATLHAETLGSLIEYDREHNADLIRSLDAFFAANGSPKEAAERLHVHRNTVLYRLDRIREITGFNLEDAAIRLRLQLALQIHVALYAQAD
jgi:purine catabolism regulator